MSPLNQANPRPSAFRRVRIAALATCFGLAVAAPIAWAEMGATAPQAPVAAAATTPSFAPLVKKVMPAVVNVSVIEKPDTPVANEQEMNSQGWPQNGFPQDPLDQFMRKFFEQQGQGFPGAPIQPSPHEQRMALGSGFIIDPAGYVVTNNHVVANAEKVTVIFQDGSKHPAKVLGRDPKTDLALLKINVDHPLPCVSWGDSAAAQVGDVVLAVGNPFGLGGTVSDGIISARGRDIHSGPYDDYLQIDAAINRGNSGGPTFNLKGQVIGINTAIYSPNGGSVGIGFAIPSNLAKPVIEQLREHGKVERGWLGVQIQNVTPELAKSLSLPKAEGALVDNVEKGGPAAKAGLKQGDVILSFDDHHVATARDLAIDAAQTPAGDHATMRISRNGNNEIVDVAMGRMPENPQLALNNGEDQNETVTALGLKLAPLTDRTREQAGVPKDVKGVVVTGVKDGSQMAQAGVQPGDVIEQVNQQPVMTPDQAQAKLEQAKGNVLLLVNRHGVSQYMALSTNNEANG
jgi:serine protease Do